MVKIKSVKAYDLKDVPDHIIQEVTDLSIELSQKINESCKKYEPNIALASIPWAMAALIRSISSEDPKELRNATRNVMVAIAKNIEFLSGVDCFNDGTEESTTEE